MKIFKLLPLVGILLGSCASMGGGSSLEKVYVVEASGGA